MCVTDRHDMTLAVKVALNPIQPTKPSVHIRLSLDAIIIAGNRYESK